MKRLLFLTAGGVAMVFSAMVQAEDQWKPSTLSDATLAKINEVALQYDRCLYQQAQTVLPARADVRDATNAIMQACEATLEPMRAAFLDEKVTPEITNRYLLRKRHQATRKVLRMMMFAQASQTPPVSEPATGGQP